MTHTETSIVTNTVMIIEMITGTNTGMIIVTNIVTISETEKSTGKHTHLKSIAIDCT